MPSRDFFAMTPQVRVDGVVLLRTGDAEAAVDDPHLSAAQIVVIGFGTTTDESASSGSHQGASSRTLQWLRSPARFSIALVHGTCGRDHIAAIASCDIVLMQQSAALSASGGDAAGLPGLGATEVLVSRLGTGRSWLLALDNGPLDANRAYAIGLADEVIGDHQVADRLDELIAKVHAMPPGWIAETASLLATATGATHEAAGRDRLRRRELDAQERLKRLREGSSD